jgi:hypothetical protein
MAWLGSAWQGKARMARLGLAWLDKARAAWLGVAGRGQARQGSRGEVRRGESGLGQTRQGTAREARLGLAGRSDSGVVTARRRFIMLKFALVPLVLLAAPIVLAQGVLAQSPPKRLSGPELQRARQAQCHSGWGQYQRQHPEVQRRAFLARCLRGDFDRYGR